MSEPGTLALRVLADALERVAARGAREVAHLDAEIDSMREELQSARDAEAARRATIESAPADPRGGLPSISWAEGRWVAYVYTAEAGFEAAGETPDDALIAAIEKAREGR